MGGYLGDKVCRCPWEIIDEVNFIQLSKSNRELARALGLKLTSAPFKNFEWLDVLKHYRDAAIDELLIKHVVATADDTVETIPENVDPRRRHTLFNEANVPRVIIVDLPELTSTDRKVTIGSVCFKMQTCASRQQNISIAFDNIDGRMDIIDWLTRARSVELPETMINKEPVWGSKAWGHSDIENSLPALPSSFVYRKRNASIVVQGTTMVDGVPKTIQKKLGDDGFLTEEMASTMIPKIIESLQDKKGDNPIEERKVFPVFKSHRT